MVKRRAQRELMNQQSKKLVKVMEESINRLKGGPKSEEQLVDEDAHCQKWVLYIIHKCHHLIRTKHIPGIYSNCHKDDLTFVEQLMKSLSMREYMDHIREEYYKMQQQKPPKTPYVYEKRAVQKMEDAFKLRYKFNQDKSMTNLNFNNQNVQEMPFNLSTHVPDKPYKKLLIYDDGPHRLPVPLQRYSEPELNISKHNFVLSTKTKEKQKDSKLPPYYIHNWDKPKCDLHFPMNIYGDNQ